MIPKRLYHIWLSDKPEGELAKRCMATWDKLGCEIIHITLDNCDVSEPFVRQALFSGTIEGRVKANDFLRMKYLYDHGGIYLDNDIEVLKPFDDLLNDGCFLGEEDSTMVNMAVLGSEPGHWFLKLCMDAMRQFRGDGPESPVTVSLGTVTRMVKSAPVLRGEPPLSIKPSRIFYPSHWTKRVAEPSEAGDAYTIHHWNQSWNETVSVVIPCFNYGHFLRDAIESALAQTYKPIEIIVVDDGSVDNTAAVARKYPEVRYIHQRNKGLSAARNAGISAARGQFIQPLDADDRLSPDCIQACVQKMQSADIVCPGQQEFGEGSRFYTRSDSGMTLRNFLAGNRIHCASMYRKKAWADVGGYDETMRVGYEDWDFWIRMLAKGYKVAVINQPQFFYRLHPKSMLRSMRPKHAEVVRKMREKYVRMGIADAAKAELVVK